MNQSTVQLIVALLPIAERLVFDIGGKLVEISTKDLTDPAEIEKALEAAKAEGFPQLRFVSAAPAAQ
ncbi:MAG TPA: hypothetical protein VF795_11645 [Desulfuromonadaceae bacterium]